MSRVDQTVFNWRTLIKKSKQYGIPLSSGAKLVAFYLHSFMNDEQDIAWPSLLRMVEETGLSRNTVKAKLAELEKAGFLVVSERVHSTRGGDQIGHQYMAVIPKAITIGGVLPVDKSVDNFLKGGSMVDKGGSTTDKRGVNGRQKGGQPLTPNNTLEIKHRERALPPTPRSPCPVDFLPTQETLQKLETLGLPKPTDKNVSAFINHYRSEGKSLADWQARFVKWCLTEKPTSGKAKGASWEQRAQAVGCFPKVGENMNDWQARIVAAENANSRPCKPIGSLYT